MKEMEGRVNLKMETSINEMESNINTKMKIMEKEIN
jgi:hypothetical protein